MDVTKKRTVKKVAVRMPSQEPQAVVAVKSATPKAKAKQPKKKVTYGEDKEPEVVYDKNSKSESESDKEEKKEEKKEKKPRKPRVKKERTDEQKEADKTRMAKLRAMKKGKKAE